MYKVTIGVDFSSDEEMRRYSEVFRNVIIRGASKGKTPQMKNTADLFIRGEVREEELPNLVNGFEIIKTSKLP